MLKTETLGLKARKNLGHFYISSILTLYWKQKVQLKYDDVELSICAGEKYHTKCRVRELQKRDIHVGSNRSTQLSRGNVFITENFQNIKIT